MQQRDEEIRKDRMDARRLDRLSREFSMPLPEDAAVVSALARLDAAESVPVELYAVVADVLSYVHRIDAESA